MCQAKGMFPDLVSFKWEKKNINGDWTAVSNDQVVVHSHNEDPVTSMVILNSDEDNSYRCTVTHEGNTKSPQQIEIKKGNLKKRSCDTFKVHQLKTQSVLIIKLLFLLL